MQRVPQTELPHLCERCGYDVDVLPKHQVCPECGCAIDGVRSGSAWQQRPSVASWLTTNIAMVLHPLRTFSQVIPERTRSVRLLWTNSVATAILFAIVPMLPGPGRSGVRTWLTDSSASRAECVVAGMILLVGPFIIAGLSFAEGLGFRLIGTRRKWRITRDAAISIVSHASIGWMVIAALTVVCMAGANQVSDSAMRHGTGPNRLYLMLLPAGAALLGAGLSLVYFETLAYIGLLRCRYANAPKRCVDRCRTHNEQTRPSF